MQKRSGDRTKETKQERAPHIRFSDFSEEVVALDGKKKGINDILNKEILITDYRVCESKYKEDTYITLQFEIEEDKHIIFSGSKVLQKQLEKYGDNIPFIATIVKRNKYFTLS